jgi:hypothetical protein
VPETDEAADIQEVQAWAAGLQALHARIAGRFTRAEPLELTRFPGHPDSWRQGRPREVRDGTHLPSRVPP